MDVIEKTCPLCDLSGREDNSAGLCDLHRQMWFDDDSEESSDKFVTRILRERHPIVPPPAAERVEVARGCLSEAALGEHRLNADRLRGELVATALKLADLAERYDRTSQWMGSHNLPRLGSAQYATVSCGACGLLAQRTGSHGVDPTTGALGEILTCGCLVACRTEAGA